MSNNVFVLEGTVFYAKIHKPDEFGGFSLVFKPNNEKDKEILLGLLEKKNKLYNKSYHLKLIDEVRDEKDNDMIGGVRLKSKLNTFQDKKTGETKEIGRISAFGPDATPLSSDILIGNGSTIKLKLQYREFKSKAGKDQAVLNPLSLQVLHLIEYNPNVSEFDPVESRVGKVDNPF